MGEQEDYFDEIRSIERYFANTDTGSILFAICNDEKLLANINTQLEFVLNGKRKRIAVHSFKQGDADTPPIQRIRNTLVKQEQTNGVIFIDAEAELYNNPNLFTQINFARELLLEFNLPMLFWMNERTIQLFRQQAIDFYNQRALANVYFTNHNPEIESDRLFEEYKAEQVTLNNPDLKDFEARLKLLQKQLHQAEESNLAKEIIANNIVIELLDIYEKMPGMAKNIKRLLTKYQPFFDIKKAETSISAGKAYTYLGDLKNAEIFLIYIVNQFRESAKATLNVSPNLAVALNNLANLHKQENKFENAKKEYEEAITILQALFTKTNEQRYLLDSASILNNLAILHNKKNQVGLAEKKYLEVLSIYKKLNKESPNKYQLNLAITLNNLAIVHNKKNEYTIAEREYNEALKIVNILANKNPQVYSQYVANTLHNLADLHSNMGNLESAETEYNTALAIRKKLAIENPDFFEKDLIDSLNSLALLHLNKNEFAFSEVLYKELLQILENSKIEKKEFYFESISTAFNNLASTYYNREDWINAEKFYNEALGIRKSLSVNNPDVFLPFVADTLANLANLHSIVKKYEIAEAEFREALDITKRLAIKNSNVFLKDVGKIFINQSYLFERKKENVRFLNSLLEGLKILQDFQHLQNTKSIIRFGLNLLKNSVNDPLKFLKENNINISIKE